MSMPRMAVLEAGLLLVAMFANATSRNNMTQIQVLDSETRSVSLGGNGVPKNCDQVNFDAYCNNSNTALLTNTLLVQEGSGPPFRISCTIDSRWSRCVPLQKGESFEARREKHGVTVYYIDDKGKARSQFYTLVDTGRKANPPATAVATATRPVPICNWECRAGSGCAGNARSRTGAEFTGTGARSGCLRADRSGEGKVQFQLITPRGGDHD